MDAGLRPAAGREPGIPRPFLLGLCAIVLGALAIRLLYILVIARAPVGIGGDAGFYHSAANLIADGRFYYRSIFSHAYLTAEHPPLYPLVLSVVTLLGGKTLLAHRVMSCVIGSLGVGLIGLLGARFGAARAGLVAAGLASVYPPFVTADGLVMSEPLFVVMVTVTMLLALHARRDPRMRVFVALGVTIGLASITRAEALLLVPLLAWPAAWLPAPGRSARLAIVTASAALVLLPWVVHNETVFHRFLIATDSATLLAGANCHDTYYGHDIGWWSLGCLARGRSREQLDRGDASTATARRYARRHLLRLPLVAAVRVLRTFNLFQPLRQGNRERRREWPDVVGLVMYYPLLLLAALGLRRMRERRWVLLAPVWMVVIVSLLGWGIGRFRIAADVSIVVLAALLLTAGRRTAVATPDEVLARPLPAPAQAG